MNRLQKLLKLTAGERRLLIYAVFLLPVTAAMLRIRSVNWTKAKLTPRDVEPRSPSSENGMSEARMVARMVNIAAERGFYKASCLRRSMVIYHLLRRQGLKGELVFGTKLDETGFSAHGWVELDGIVINDSENISEKYKAFDQPVEVKN